MRRSPQHPAVFCAQWDHFSQLDRQVGVICALSSVDPDCGAGPDFTRAARGGPSATLRGLKTAAGPLWEPPMALQAGLHPHPQGPGWSDPDSHPHSPRARGRPPWPLWSLAGIPAEGSWAGDSPSPWTPWAYACQSGF